MFEASLFSHWLGDYIFQTPLKYKRKSVAIIKHENTIACLYHVLVYTLCFVPICMFQCDNWYVPLFLIGLTHFIQDRYWLPMKYFMENAKKLTYTNDFYEKDIIQEKIDSIKEKQQTTKYKFNEIKYINSATWYPALYIIFDNGYHIFCNYFILLFWSK